MPGFGASFNRAVRERHPAHAELHQFGKILPRPTDPITVDSDRTDRYGVPLAHIDFDICGNERKTVEAMYDKPYEIFDGM